MFYMCSTWTDVFMIAIPDDFEPCMKESFGCNDISLCVIMFNHVCISMKSDNKEWLKIISTFMFERLMEYLVKQFDVLKFNLKIE